MRHDLPFGEICADLLRAGHAVRFAATGCSMAPTIRAGDVLTIEPLGARDLREGDVAFYTTARGLTAHRVLERLPGRPATFRARGDAPGSEEEVVAEGQLLGRVADIERGGKRTAVANLPAWQRFGSRLASRIRRLTLPGSV